MEYVIKEILDFTMWQVTMKTVKITNNSNYFQKLVIKDIILYPHDKNYQLFFPIIYHLFCFCIFYNRLHIPAC